MRSTIETIKTELINIVTAKFPHLKEEDILKVIDDYFLYFISRVNSGDKTEYMLLNMGRIVFNHTLAAFDSHSMKDLFASLENPGKIVFSSVQYDREHSQHFIDSLKAKYQRLKPLIFKGYELEILGKKTEKRLRKSEYWEKVKKDLESMPDYDDPEYIAVNNNRPLDDKGEYKYTRKFKEQQREHAKKEKIRNQRLNSE